jgi:hypothetical protein
LLGLGCPKQAFAKIAALSIFDPGKILTYDVMDFV